MSQEQSSIRDLIVDILVGEIEYDNHFAPTEQETTDHHIKFTGEITDAILELILSRLPEEEATYKKVIDVGSEFATPRHYRQQGFNTCLSEVRAILKGNE